MPKVYNISDYSRPSGCFSVMRPSIFGNPFKIGVDGTRDQVIAKYAEYLNNNDGLKAKAIQLLRGKDLLCCCAPLPCHADILLEVANADS